MADERAEENGSDPKQDAQSETQAEKKPSLLERYPIVRYVLIAALAAGIIAAIVWYMNYRASGQYLQSTNNAYVRADFVTVSPKVGGYVERVLVADNQHVRRGQLLAILDPRDYRANVDQAQAQIAAAGANITTARRTLDEQRATVAQAAAQVASAEAAAAAAENEVRRYEPLARTGAESRERLANLVLQRDRTAADLRAQRAAYLAARRSVATQAARIGQAEAQRGTAQAQLARASTDLGAVEIRSSIDGVVADKAVRAGQYVQPATRLMSVVPVDQLYIEANFKETQVALMRVGQPVTIKVDALDGAELRGRVASFSPGTGAQFSLIPPENATGNFTKIVQRVPVRISIEAGPEARRVLRPGLSVEVTVDTIGAKGSRERIEQETERLKRGETQGRALMAAERAGLRDWLAVAAGTIGSFMALLDISIVNAALPTIQGEIGASGTEGTWVATSYLVAEIVMIPLSPFLVRLFGLRNFLLGAAVSFTGFSIVCGISTTLPMMIAGRVGQGFTGGALIPTAMTIIATRLPPSQQPIGTAAFGGTAILGPVLGPIIGGWLTDNYSWHYAFFLNVPVCAGLVLLLLFGLKHERLRLDQLRHADWFGIAGLAIGLGALTVMLEEGQREMWFESAMIVKLALATVFGFALITLGQVRSAHPVLKLSLIFSRSFGSVFVLSLIIGVVLYGVTFLIPQFLSSMADYSALQSGKVVFVSGIPALMLMPFLPLAFKYLDVRLAVFVGMTLIGVSCAMDWHLTAQSAGGDLTDSQLVRGFGQIFAMMFLNQAAISAVAPEDAGDASALFNAGRNLGGSIGLALMATLQDRQTFLHFNRLGETVSANAATTQEWFAKAMAMPSGEAGAYRQLAGQLLEQSTVMAYNDLFFALGVAIAITTPLALFLRPISSDTQMAMH